MISRIPLTQTLSGRFGTKERFSYRGSMTASSDPYIVKTRKGFRPRVEAVSPLIEVTSSEQSAVVCGLLSPFIVLTC